MIRRLAVVLVGLLTFGAFGVALLVWWFGRRDRPLGAGVAVVLGAKVFQDGTPSDALVRRALRAAEWQRAAGGQLLLSGGSRDARCSEAEALRRLLASRGIAATSLHLEEASLSTADNAWQCARWLQSREVRGAEVITDRFHLLRARQLFRGAGVEVGTVGVEPEQMRRFDRLYWVLREGLALAVRPRLLWARPPASAEDWRGGRRSR